MSGKHGLDRYVRHSDKGGGTGALCLTCGGQSRSACELAGGGAWDRAYRDRVTDVWVDETAGARAVIHATIANRGVNGDQLLRLSFGSADRVAIVDGVDQEIESLRIPADSELVQAVLREP